MSKQYIIALILLALGSLCNGVQRFYDDLPLTVISILFSLISFALFISEAISNFKK